MRLIGAGVGRTGTHSLKLAIEQLLDAKCHHMMEVDADQVDVWRRAFEGEPIDWPAFLADYEAIVDWPGGGLWPELNEAFPDVPVLLSTRSSSEAWYRSASSTILPSMNESDGAGRAMLDAMMSRFTLDWNDADAAMAAYDAHNAAVRSAIPADRLFEYQPGDGWAPLCAALGVEEPSEPFPHTNTTEQYQERRQRRRDRAAD